MPILTVILIFIAIGILLALVNKYGPPYIDPKFIWLINAVVFIATIVWLMKISGLWAYLSRVTV